MAIFSGLRIGPHAALGVVLALVLAVPLGAQVPEKAPPSPEKGRELAGKLCKNCHVVEGEVVASVPAGLPSLRGIANLAGQSGGRILDILIKPHYPMPDLQLSIDEILDIVSYLETLRTNPAVPPLIVPAKPGEKARMPSRS